MEGVIYHPLAGFKEKRKIKSFAFVPAGSIMAACIIIKVISMFPFFIEKYYSRGIYPYLAASYRFVFGWLPFSLGDVLYFATGCYILWHFIKFFITVFRGAMTKAEAWHMSKKMLFIVAGIYIYFNLCWGLNYNRPGIATQLALTPQMHNATDLRDITTVLLKKVNDSRRAISAKNIGYKPYGQVFREAQKAYTSTSVNLPFLSYNAASIKKSMYGRMGNFLGFLGYYNPFTGEAQLNLTMPRFLLPYVTCHEMAHQLGYASESEASFVGYLAALHSADTMFRYSTYFDMFTYANHELFLRDSVAAKNNYRQLDTLVKTDMIEVRNYWKKSENMVEPLIKIFYDHYLKANQQSNGLKSYNEVVGWLIAYYKKYGEI